MDKEEFDYICDVLFYSTFKDLLFLDKAKLNLVKKRLIQIFNE